MLKYKKNLTLSQGGIDIGLKVGILAEIGYMLHECALLFLYLVHNDPSSPLECGVVLKCSFKVLIVQILVQDIQENLLFVEMLSKSFHFILANC